MFNSIGGMSNEIEQSYTSTVLNTAKSISKGITKITESVVNTVVTKTSQLATSPSSSSSITTNINESPRNNRKSIDRDDYQAGICTIIDTYKYKNNNLHDENQTWIIAHFLAHQEPIYALEFNHSGRLLATADTLGQYFNIYLISPNPFKSTRANIKHIYSLYRGDTTSKVKDISFSYDSRWLAVSTKRGTTHIFPINSCGGQINSRTHSNPYVVNRASRHSRTAGFTEEDHHQQLQQSNQQQQHQLQQLNQQTSAASQIQQHNSTDYNPRIRTTLEPFVIQALNQIRQPYSGSNISAVTANAVDNVTHFGIMNFFGVLDY
jgi:WD40 repeat protein